MASVDSITTLVLYMGLGPIWHQAPTERFSDIMKMCAAERQPNMKTVLPSRRVAFLLLSNGPDSVGSGGVRMHDGSRAA